jgi:hypothetical protein
MYQDINGNQFESYAQACQYYGGENDAVLDGEAEQADAEYDQYLATYHGAHACELYYQQSRLSTIPF